MHSENKTLNLQKNVIDREREMLYFPENNHKIVFPCYTLKAYQEVIICLQTTSVCLKGTFNMCYASNLVMEPISLLRPRLPVVQMDVLTRD